MPPLEYLFPVSRLLKMIMFCGIIIVFDYMTMLSESAPPGAAPEDTNTAIPPTQPGPTAIREL